MAFNHEKISEHTWRVIEGDRFDRNPYLYVTVGIDKCVVIDNGIGTGNFKNFINTFINTSRLPFWVICTDVQYDHVGACHHFEKDTNMLQHICFGDNDRKYTLNLEQSPYIGAPPGAKVQPFKVTKWLANNDLIYFDDKNPRKDMSLQVIYTPGRTPDSIALYSHWEHRLFVGDNIHPTKSIFCGYDFGLYISSLKALQTFVQELPSPTHVAKPSPSKYPSLSAEQRHKLNAFLNAIGLDEAEASRHFHPVNFLENFHEWDENEAIENYLKNKNEISSLVPPDPQPMQIEAPTEVEDSKINIRISCGHEVQDESPLYIEKFLSFLHTIISGSLAGKVSGANAIYTSDPFEFIIPTKVMEDYRRAHF